MPKFPALPTTVDRHVREFLNRLAGDKTVLHSELAEPGPGSTLNPENWRERFQGKPAACTSAQIMANSYTDRIFRVFRDEQQILELPVTSNRGFRLPAGRVSRWQIELTGTNTVTAVIVASSMGEL